ncbi:MAG TPA: ShlB/FhaC/HecB family hemolysin secretion/activation protein [Cyanophyceae cyanobacterium]
MRLLRCEVLIKRMPVFAPASSQQARRLRRKLASVCVGMACLSGLALISDSQLTNAATLTSLLKTKTNSTDPFSALISPDEIDWLDSLEAISSHLSEIANILPNLLGQPSLQAQTPPVTPPVSPENLQPNPNQERFLQPAPSPQPVPTETTPPVQPAPTPSPEPSPTSPPEQTIRVNKIEVTGSTVFKPEELNAIVKPYEGREITLEQLREAADKITQLYLDRGYITSRAILANQVIPASGVVVITVLEGSLEEIRIEGTRRLNPDYVRRRVQLGAGTPLSTARLEDQLRLLRADPLFENVEASLRAGSVTGKSILIVRVVEANPFEGSVSIDNYSPPSVGSERLGASALYRNVTGNGDAIAASYYHTTRSGSDNFDLTYRVPVNPMNGALKLRASFNQNKIVDDALKIFNIEGSSELYEISFQQPLVRTPRQEFALSLGLAVQESKSLAGPFPISPGANEDGITNTTVLRFGQDYVRRDIRGAWSVRSLFSLGTGWFGATVNPNPEPDGRFFSWLGQVQRVQVLNEDNFLIVGADIQLTPDTLLPSQQFVVGGGQSLRGYRQNIRARDNGVRFSLEDRITLERDADGAPIFQLAPFFDAAYVWNDPNNPAEKALRETQREKFLAGLGLGVIWEPLPQLNVRVDYAVPLVDINDKGTNAQDEGFYFSVRYNF